ncbi:MAG: group I intron-associated PD-(D/E)XK endonuclease [Candidatus Sulfotelmatobacter sp.]
MNSSERGEWAEIRFVGRAAEQRFRVSKPWGNTLPYDLMVERDGRFTGCR